MTPQELAEAEAMLARRPEYAWLTQGENWFNLSEVAAGMGISRDTVRKWCEEGKIPGAVNYGDKLGWRMPKSGLVEYFASLTQGKSGQQAG
jgi:excisionase family DNA binding protein